MTRFLLASCLLALAACAGSPTTRISGAETRSATDTPRIVPAAVTTTRQGLQMELVTADGIPLTGMLQRAQTPVIVPLAATGQPLVGGQPEMIGQIQGGGVVMDCRFLLLNQVRGIDGGGSGTCQGAGRQVAFLF
jgi:hypothetical protein